MRKVTEVQAEIEYIKPDGSKVHSDIEPRGCKPEGLKDPEYREFLHKCLDEWLDNAEGTCGFYIKDKAYQFDCTYDDEEAVLGDHNLIPSYKAEIEQLKAAIKPVAKWWRKVDSDGLDEVVVELTTDELNALDALGAIS